MIEDQLNDLSIFALRELARRTGVNSPTSKKKSQLIEEIIEITEGKKLPQLTKTKQGRPPKNYGYTFADMFMSSKNAPTYSQSVLAQDRPTFNCNLENSSVMGYVEVSTNLSAFLWVKQGNKDVCYYIPSSLIRENNIRTGDKVLAEVLFNDGQNLVKEILTINNQPINKFNKDRVSYFQIDYVDPFRDVKFNSEKFNNLKIKFGESVYLYGNNNKLNTEQAVDILNSCESENKIYLNISLAEKNRQLILNLKDVELFTSEITSDKETVVRTLNLLAERVKRLFETGEDVVLLIDDVQSIIGVDNEDLLQVKKIMSLPKSSNNGSITLFAIMPNQGFPIFEKLADKRFKVSEKNLFLID